jgi:hypothetical protein
MPVALAADRRQDRIALRQDIQAIEVSNFSFKDGRAAQPAAHILPAGACASRLPQVRRNCKSPACRAWGNAAFMQDHHGLTKAV